MRKPRLSKNGERLLKEVKLLKFDDYDAVKQLAKMCFSDNNLQDRRAEFLSFRIQYESLEGKYEKMLRRMIEAYKDKIPGECWRSDGKLKNNWFNNVKDLELFYLIKTLRSVRKANLEFTSFLFAVALHAHGLNSNV